MRALAATLVAGLLAIAVAACGLQSGGEGASGAAVTAPQKHAPGAASPNLPPRPAGEVGLEGNVNGGINRQALDDFRKTKSRGGLAINVVATPASSAAAFNDLCSGTTDVVSSAVAITDAQVRACNRNGLEVIDLPAAFDATVVATRNESNVGADCVTMDQLRQIMQPGSRVDSWTQLSPDYKPVRLRPVGRRPPASEVDFLIETLFGVPNPSLADLRADYKSFATEDGVRKAVWNHPPGRLGVFRFTYYQVYEEQLRPLEIDAQQDEGCIFPSAGTVESETYPLGETFHLYTVDRSVARPEVSTFLTAYLRSAPQIAAQKDLIPLSVVRLNHEINRIENVSQKVAQSSNASATTTSTAP